MNRPTSTPLEAVLELARWAPSGDNTQPWRFEITDPTHVVVHGFDTREDCLYDFQGRASQIALGALLQNIELAASLQGWVPHFTLKPESTETSTLVDVQFQQVTGTPSHPLATFIRERSVQRRPFSTHPLTGNEKTALSESLGPDHTVFWIEGAGKRLQMARLMSQTGRLRLTIPEAYQVHKKVIEWKSRHSEDKVPDQAIGLDPVTLKLMRWVMQSWHRVNFFNTWLGGTWTPRLELDILPAWFCGAHFVLQARTPPKTTQNYLDAGRALQRFWLTATRLGLQLQPEMAPLIFHRYASSNVAPSLIPGTMQAVKSISQALSKSTGEPETLEHAVFMGRIGHSFPARARSLRLPLSKLGL